MKNKYKPTIGLEIHVQLKTKSKMFCGCPNNSWKIGVEELKPNTSICSVCSAQPGSLPVANREAIDMVIKAGLALNCKIAKQSKFDRKNYFYPDLPKGYQISQYDKPLAEHGYIEIGGNKVGITRIHLEEDTGKLIHPVGEDYSLVDLNRAGVPLMEMVTEPDIHSGSEAKEFCQELQKIFRYLNISEANMEKSQMRCEVNISISDTDKLGTKVEIKNLNSFKVVERSIEYETMRQAKVLEAGEEIVQETRGWDEKGQKTFSQRSKEDAHDYRYFPEPDLPLLEFDDDYIAKIKAELPELPREKLNRFKEQYGFKQENAKILVDNKEMADYTENVMSDLRNWLSELDEVEDTEEAWNKNKEKLSKLAGNWLINKFSRLLIDKNEKVANCKVTAENFAEFLILIYENRVNASKAMELLDKMIKTGGDPSNILEDEGMKLIDDVSDLEPIVDKIMADNLKQVEQFKAGKGTVLKYFVGQVMKESQGQANPKMVEDLLLQKLT